MSYSDVVVRTGTSIIVSKSCCGDSRTVMMVADSMGSIGVELHSMLGIVRYGSGLMSTGVSIAGAVTVSLNARCCLEPVDCDEDLVDALVLSSNFS